MRPDNSPQIKHIDSIPCCIFGLGRVCYRLLMCSSSLVLSSMQTRRTNRFIGRAKIYENVYIGGGGATKDSTRNHSFFFFLSFFFCFLLLVSFLSFIIVFFFFFLFAFLLLLLLLFSKLLVGQMLICLKGCDAPVVVD